MGAEKCPRGYRIDAITSLVARVTAYDVGFGDLSAQDPQRVYLALSAGLPLLWLSAMAAARAYEARFLSVEFEEFRRVLVAADVVIAPSRPPPGRRKRPGVGFGGG